MLQYNYSKLLGKITEKFGSNSNFASRMGLSDRTISLKLNNKVEWKQSEIAKAMELLDISEIELFDYFFDIKVQSD